MRIGIIGTGRIAKRFVPEALSAGGIEITAVFNPHNESAKKFLSENTLLAGVVPLSDTDKLWKHIEAVYIASPHETHVPYIKEALKAGKHVLCEKPMMLNAKEAKECFGLAEEKGLVLMEAIKTTWCPGYRKLLETARSGIIGDIKYIEACFTKLEAEGKRELTDRKYGGSFTELGSYVMLPIIDIFGSGFEDVKFTSIDNGLGIDILTKTDFIYKNALASATCGLEVKKEGSLIISGTKGYIKAEAPWWKTTVFEAHFEDPGRVIRYEEPFEGDGLRYEIREFLKRIENFPLSSETGKIQSRSICMADVMERFLSDRRKAEMP